MPRNLPGNRTWEVQEVKHVAYNFIVASSLHEQLEKSACFYIQIKVQWNLNTFPILIRMLAGSINED